MSVIEKLKDATIPSLIGGAFSVGLYYMLYDQDLTATIPFANMNVPAWAAVGGSSFIGAEVGSLLTEFVGPKIPMLSSVEGAEKMIIPPAMAGLGTYGAMRLLISEDASFSHAFILGAGGDLASKYIYKSL